MATPLFVTDSTAYLPENLRQQYGIQVVPQVLNWEQEELLDGIDIQPTQFYERLSNAREMPTTSQASPASFMEQFQTATEQGRPAICILVSDKLSGTIQSAQMARAEFSQIQIEIIDSQSAAMGMGFQVLAAARAAQAGKPIEEVLQTAREAIPRTGVVLMVDTLEFLHRGGRIGGAARLLGTALNLKPILELQNGVLEAVDRVRTRSKATARLLDLLEERIDGRSNVRLAVLHAAAEPVARDLLEQAASRVNPVEQVFSEVSPVVGAHVGPGTVGLCYSVEF